MKQNHGQEDDWVIEEEEGRRCAREKHWTIGSACQVPVVVAN